MLVQNTESGYHTEKQPEPFVSAIENAQSDSNASHPEDRLKRIHGEKIIEGEVDGRAKHRERGKELRESSTANFARNPAAEKNLCRSGKSGKKTQREERIA